MGDRIIREVRPRIPRAPPPPPPALPPPPAAPPPAAERREHAARRTCSTRNRDRRAPRPDMLIERLSSEKAAAEEETRRILHRAFSEAEANEMGDLKKLRRNATPRCRRPRPATAPPPHPHPTPHPPPHAHTHSRSLRSEGAPPAARAVRGQREDRPGAVVAARAPRARAHRARPRARAQKAHATLQTKLGEIDALERRVALLTHDTGVERALAMVRDANEPPAPAAGAFRRRDADGAAQAGDTDLNKLGLEPLVKRQQEVPRTTT